MDILWCYWDLMVRPDKVNVCEDSGSLECGRKVLEMGDRVPVRQALFRHGNPHMVSSLPGHSWEPCAEVMTNCWTRGG